MCTQHSTDAAAISFNALLMTLNSSCNMMHRLSIFMVGYSFLKSCYSPRCDDHIGQLTVPQLLNFKSKLGI